MHQHEPTFSLQTTTKINSHTAHTPLMLDLTRITFGHLIASCSISTPPTPFEWQPCLQLQMSNQTWVVSGVDGSLDIIAGDRASAYCVHHNDTKYSSAKLFPQSNHVASFTYELEAIRGVTILVIEKTIAHTEMTCDNKESINKMSYPLRHLTKCYLPWLTLSSLNTTSQPLHSSKFIYNGSRAITIMDTKSLISWRSANKCGNGRTLQTWTHPRWDSTRWTLPRVRCNVDHQWEIRDNKLRRTNSIRNNAAKHT